MATLKSSQRISYKATYNQISPPPDTQKGANNPTQSLQRAVEKTAFLQSLRIIPQEVDGIDDLLTSQEDLSSQILETLPTVMEAIKQLISDTTATSTLNNAPLFAEIDPSTLIVIANALMAHRQSAADVISKSIADILISYRRFLLPLPQSPKRAVGTSLPGLALTKAARTVASMTESGIPITTTIVPAVASKPSNANSELESGGYSVHIAVDASKPAPAAMSSVLAMDPSVKYTPSNSDAIVWAEKNQPQLFADLTNLLQPYMGLSDNERTAIGDSAAMLHLLTHTFVNRFATDALARAIAGFNSRMQVEPIGYLHLERIEMYPEGVERGELVHSVSLAPGETVNVSHKEWSVRENEFEEIVQDYMEGYSEQGVAEKSDIAMSSDSQFQHSTALNIGASLSASYASVTLSTSFGYNATSNDTQSKKDSRNHSMAITKKASARTKKDHKVTFKVTSVTGSDDQSVRVISNPSPTDPMRIDYFQFVRKWKVDLLRYGLRMTYDIVIPNPGSGIITLVENVKKLDALIDTPFTFDLPLSTITYNPFAKDAKDISNYDTLAARYNASVTAPPPAQKWANVHKETSEVTDSDHIHFDSAEFDIDDNYYISEIRWEFSYQPDGKGNASLRALTLEYVANNLKRFYGLSGHLSFDFMCQYMLNYAFNLTLTCVPKPQVVIDWRLQVWNEIRQAAEDQYNKALQDYRDQRAKLIQEIADYDALTLRRMEQEEVMKGVLRWILGPSFHLVPFNISSLFFDDDSNDPNVHNVLDPNRLSEYEWLDVMERGEFIKYLHNAIEWENVLYFTYPYFWDDYSLWDFKKFLYHPDATHRKFLRSGAARVVLTIRPGFEPSFTRLVESGAFNKLPGPHPYVTIAQEIQDFANTNYPGFPPANPEQNARPLLYLEQRRVWREMQFIIQLLNACKSATGTYPPPDGVSAVPGALKKYLDGPVVISGKDYNGINDYNTQANAQQLALDPTTPEDAQLPTYANVPINDIVWNRPYFYKCPGDTGDYDLISFGADGTPDATTGGVGNNADISANSEASLTATWYEYTPINALDIGITVNKPNVVPPQPSTDIA